MTPGDYTIEAATYSPEATGEFTLTLSGLPTPPPDNECEQALVATITESSWTDECDSQNRENAYARFYTFTLGEQSIVTVTLESKTDPYLYLLDSEDDVVADNDDIDRDGDNYNSQIQETLEPGDYTIEATTYGQPATGDFLLTVSVLPIDEEAQATPKPTPEPTGYTRADFHSTTHA